MLEKKFKIVGKWINDNTIELIELDECVYALNGWNGDEYTDCWIVFGDNECSEERYTIEPIYKEVNSYEIIGYEVIENR